MRVQLIHGGPWDGWRVVELDDGRRKIVHDVGPEIDWTLRHSAHLEEITPASERISAAHLTVIEGGS